MPLGSSKGAQMLDEKFQLLTGMTWEEAATLSNELFIEADKLEERAYQLLKKDQAGSEVWSEFASSKRAAKSVRAEARRAWLQATLVLNSIDPRAGRAHSDRVH
jgi:hypothetical protein